MVDVPKPTLKERQWNLREDAILDAASELMGGKGYNAMTMDDVSNLVGISKATLYLHFSSKHDLVISVACRTVDRAYEQMTSIDPELSAGDRLRQLVSRIVEARFGPDNPPFIEAVGELIEILGSDHPFMQKERRNVEFIQGVLEDAGKEGVLVEGISIFVAVNVIIGTLRCIELERAIEAKQTDITEIGETIIRMLIRS